VLGGSTMRILYMGQLAVPASYRVAYHGDSLSESGRLTLLLTSNRAVLVRPASAVGSR